MKFPDKLDVLAVHASLISETGGSAGLRDEGLLTLARDNLNSRKVSRIPDAERKS